MCDNHLSNLADILNKTGRGIECRIINNSVCLDCGVVHKEMVKVGAFVLCNGCWEREFNVDEIPKDGELREKYNTYLKKYRNND